ncbi:hypothetical protein F441_18510 [Phytophthora nicotianae CJ01A1]|uniref:Chromo domain-containing protein n=4 Tax=Phytophthora nicotianae TaxID=4792 RepID=V9E7D1_PHYNI|nr:hypothetical protein F443_18650 [Phytophthora nicotianae P1569]ETK75256.1 hypothetical protein L915_18131 [Phytophthora nicotianae]ETO63723.1 hypothetical protein F444_18645 [Phytophthora nicotianae P1976]ETP04791.1 hypothetical protein F441_18510 [Phytophthora nicotianae CJ01A1]ETL28683.1 hypothetical protein L916_18033 [Phytophthora nicotianae]
MAAAPAPARHAQGGNSDDAADRVKDFFITWLRLMERQHEVTVLSQELQNLLAPTRDAATQLQDARHQANLLSATDKTITGLMASINDYFHRDIVPALNRAKQADNESPQQAQDSLSRYLAHGDEGEAMPQDFVDDMSGWGAEREQSGEREKENADKNVGDDMDSGDEISSEIFHDMLLSNSVKLTAMLAPDYVQPAVAQGVATAARMRVPSPSPATASPRAKSKVKTNKRSGKVPPPVVTDLPPRPASGSVGSTPRTQPQTPTEETQRKDRVGKRIAANLTAEQVLGIRTYGKAKEFCIRWQGVEKPLWISRRKAPPQTRELIDLYAAEVRARDNQSAMNPKSKKKTSRNGAAGAQEAQFYTVDHIVNHRLFNKKREYLVRWENYDASDDTWEKADKLRVDVPEIVEAYEEQLYRNRAPNEAVSSAMSELHRDAQSKFTTKKRKIGKSGREDPLERRKRQPSVTRSQIDGEHPKEKRLRVATNEEEKRHDADGDNASENDFQFEMEEAELHEYADEEFADKLNN